MGNLSDTLGVGRQDTLVYTGSNSDHSHHGTTAEGLRNSNVISAARHLSANSLADNGREMVNQSILRPAHGCRLQVERLSFPAETPAV